MFPDNYIEIVRQAAYPIGAPEGVEYERQRVRECLEAAANFRIGKDRSDPRSNPAARDEAVQVFKICADSVYGASVRPL
jgi:hypothetical protein